MACVTHELKVKEMKYTIARENPSFQDSLLIRPTMQYILKPSISLTLSWVCFYFLVGL